MKKFYLFLTLLTAFLWLGTGTMWGQDECTVGNTGTTTTSRYVPVYGYYCDYLTHSQIIYDKSLLSDMANGTITGITFYSTSATQSWGSAKFTVKIAKVDASSLSALNTTASFTTVVASSAASVSSNKLQFTFDAGKEFDYDGTKNLLVDIELTTKGSASSSSSPVYEGITTASNVSYEYHQYNSSIGQSAYAFLPKTTFIYEGAATCPKPKNVHFTDLKSTTASFAWEQGGEETSWQYICLPAATAIDWSDAPVQTTTSASATITGLSAETNYKFYVRSYCSGSDQSKDVIKAFKTPCTGEALPWNQNFDDMTTGTYSSAAPTCWDMINANAGSYPYIYVSTSYAKSGKGIYFVSSKDKYGYIILPAFASPTNILKASFWYKNEGTSASNGQITLGYITDVSDESTFTPVETCTRTTTYTQKQNILFTSAPSFARIAFRYGGGSSDNFYAGVDNVLIETTQDCSKPATPTYTDLTGNSVTINWAANAGVSDYKYINVDRTANPSYVLDWEHDATAISATSVNLTSLVDGHNYEFYVMCACGTVASDACSYTPLSCPAVTGVTLSNQVWNAVTVNWTTSATANCDVQYKAGSGEWQAAETNTSATSKTITGLSVGTEYSFRVKPNCSADGWVSPASTYTPACPALGALTLSVKTYNGVTVSWPAATGISSWNLRYRKGSDSWTEVNNIAALTYTIASGLVTNEEYTIEVSSECGGSPMTTTYTPVYEKPSSATVSTIKDISAYASWITVDGVSGYQYSCVPTGDDDSWSATQASNSASLTGLSAAVGYTFKVRAVFGAVAYSEATERTFTTVCQAPTSLVKGATTSSSLAFSWSKSAVGNADNRYQYVCKEGSAAPTADQWANDAVLLDEGVRSATVEGLSANTTYYFFVRSYYGEGKYSSAINTNNTTDCGTEGIGYTENFASGVKPGCWTISNWGTSANYWTTANDYSYSGYALRYNARTSSTCHATSPSISLPEKAELTYYVRNYYYYYNDYYISGNVVISDGVTSKVEAYGSNKNITKKTIDLSEFVGKTVTITFQGNGATTSTNAYLWIDDIAINYKACAKPTALAATPTEDGAIVTWSHDEADGHYDLQYRVNGSSDEWIMVDNIAEKTKTLTGLTPGTTYDVRVRANCSAHRISSWTSAITFEPQCAAPTGLTNEAETYNSISLSWTGDAKAIRYKKGTDEWTSVAFDPAKTSYTVSGLATGEEYTIQVQAACAPADEHWSDAFLFTPSCGTPTALAVVAESETQTGAQISWTAGNGEAEWEVQYKKDGDADYTTLTGITANPYTFTGLTAGTHYYARVAAVCNDSYTSAVEFNTVCPANYALPFEQNFDLLTAGIPLCWDNAAGTTAAAASKWNYTTSGHSGKAVRFNSGWDNAEGNTNILKTPAVAIGADKAVRLEFWYRNEWGGDLSVFYTLDGVKQTPALATGLTNKASWTKQTINLPACAGHSIAIWFEATSNQNTKDDPYIYLDDVAVVERPACVEPTGVEATTIGVTTATIEWTAGDSESAWKLQYKVDGGSWSGDINVATTPSHELTGLTENTLYYVRVKADCGGSQSDWSVEGSFRTECAARSLEFSDDFEAGVIPACWEVNNVTTKGWETYSYTDETGSLCLRYNANGSSGNYELLATPSITISDKATLKFVRKTTATSPEFKVLISTNGGTTKTEIGSFAAATSKKTDSISLNDYKNQTVIIYFQGKSTGAARYVYLDDVQVSYMYCAKPTNLAALATPDGAILTWNHDEEDGHYDLQYRVHVDEGEENEWTTIANIAEKTRTLTGLTQDVVYDVRVRANCSANRQSGYTDAITFTPTCEAPANLAVASSTYNSAVLTWIGSAKSLRYQDEDDADWRTPITISPAASTYTLTGLATGKEHTVQVLSECDTDNSKWSASFNFTPTCVTPSDLTVVAESETQTGAQISWTAGNGEAEWKVQYKKEGDAEYTTLTGITTNPYTFTGLAAGTHYYARVAAVCDDNYTADVEFNTACLANYAMPFVQDFNDLTAGIPVCWDNAEGTTTVESYKWNSYATGHEGKCVRFDSYNNNTGYSLSNNTNFLKTPAIAVTETANLEFWYKNPNGGDFSVYYSIDGGAQTALTGATGLTGASEWTKKKVELPAACEGHNVVIIFKGTSNWGSYDAYIYLDDVKVAAKPACQAPSEVVVSSITKNSASISWTNGDEESNWKLQYKDEDDVDWTDANSGDAFNTKPFALSGLSARTLYYVRVKAVCNPATSVESEEWSEEASFTTDCDYVDMPFSEGFANTLPECWHLAVSGADNWEYYTTAYHTAAPSMRFNANTATENYGDLITPYINIDDDANLTFYLKNTLEINAKLYAQVDGEAAVEVQDIPTTTSANFEQQTVDLSSYVGNHVRFIFRAYGNATNYNYIYIDDVNVSIKPCSDPTFTEGNVTVTADGAIISCAESKWNLQYRTNGVGEWTAVNDITAASYTLTGLTSGTTYEVQIQHVCSATRKSEWTASQTFTPACLAPTALTAAPAVTSASISWTGSADKLQYRAHKDEEPLNEWSEETVSTSPFNITGLTASSKYDVRIKAACGDVWTDAVAFTTWCNSTLSIPTEITSFDAIPTCWEVSPAGAVEVANSKLCFLGEGEKFLYLPQTEINLDQLSVTLTFSGTLELGYISAPNGAFTSLGALTSDEEVNIANPASVGYLAIRYNGANNYAQSAISAIRVRLTPTCFKPLNLSAASSITPVGATFSWEASGHGEETYQWAVAQGSNAPEWEDDAEHKVNSTSKVVTGLNAGTSYKFYVRSYCTSEDQSDAAVSAAFTTATVPAPTEAVVYDITKNAASISWTAAAGISQYQYVVMGAGEPADWTSPTTVNTTAASLTGLNASTTYDLYIRSFYAETATSDAMKVTFHTECDVITVDASHPYVENFNSLESGIPACWDNSEGTTVSANYKWKSTTGGQDGKCLMFNGTENGLGNTNVLATPVFNISADVDLTFYWKNARTGAYTVEISVDGGARTTLVESLTGESTWTLQEASLAAYNGHNIQLFFCGTSAGDGNANLYLDEVQIAATECRKPASDPVASDISANGATITWTAGGSETDYQFALALKDQAPVWEAANVVSALTKSFGDLSPMTNYDFYVRTYCDSENQSDERKVSFRTECAGFVTLPFEENFNALAYQTIPDCWNNDEGTSADYYKWKAETPVGSTNYVRFNSLINEDGATNILATPLIQLGEGNLLTFKTKNPTGGAFKVQIKEEGEEPADLITGLTGIADWTLKYAAIPAAYNNKKVQILFHATSNDGTGDAYIYLDDVRVARGEIFEDGNNTDVETRLSDLNDQTIDFVMTRPMQYNGYYNTLCLPFNVSASDMAESDHPFYNCTLKAFDYAVVTDELQLAIIGASSIEAGVPYFVRYDGASTADKTALLFKEVTIAAETPSAKEDNNVTYSGIFNTITATPESSAEDHKPECLFVGGENQLYWPTTARKMNAFRAYFSITYGGAGSAPIKRGMSARLVERPNAPTGVDNAQGNEVQSTKVLENNQVIIIRNGVKYSVQGQKIQ